MYQIALEARSKENEFLRYKMMSGPLPANNAGQAARFLSARIRLPIHNSSQVTTNSVAHLHFQ